MLPYLRQLLWQESPRALQLAAEADVQDATLCCISLPLTGEYQSRPRPSCSILAIVDPSRLTDAQCRRRFAAQHSGISGYAA